MWFTPTNQLWKFRHRLYGRFSSNPRSKSVFLQLWIVQALYFTARSCDAMYRVRESKSKLELFYRIFVKLFCHIFLALGLNTSSKEFETIATYTKEI